MRRTRINKPAWPFVCNQQSQQALGLIGWWPGGPKGGLRLIDQGCTRNNHGTLTNFSFTPSSGWVAGKDGGYALRYDGTNDHVIVSDMPEADNRSNLTYSCWAFQDSLSSSRSFAAKWDYQTQGSWGFLTNSPSGDLAVYTATTLADGGSNGATTATSVWTAGAWHHVCMVYNGTLAAADRLKIYIDGIYRTTTPFGTIPTVLLNSTATLKLGRFGGALGWYFNGVLDDHRLYNRSLSPSQVYQMYSPSTRWELRYQPGIHRTFQVGGAPTFTGTIAVTTAAATPSLIATFTPVSISSTIALTTDEVTGSLAATFTPVPITSSLALTLAAATTSIDATFTGVGSFDGTIDVTTAATTGSLAATFTEPVFTSTVALTTAATTTAIASTFTPVAVTSTLGLTTAATTVAIASTFTPVAVTSTLGLTTAPVSGVIAASFVEQGVFGSSITVTTAPASGSLAASSTLVSITSTLALTTAAATGALAGTVSVPTFSATIGVTTAAVTSVSNASFVAAGTVDASIAVTTGFVTGQLTATFTSPSTTCVVNVEIGAATCTILMGGALPAPTIAERFCVPAIQRRFTVPTRKKC